MAREKTILLLQGGGALGAYQGGAFKVLTEGGHAPDWIAGISIGAINAAIIAGNAPEARAAKLRAFWDTVSRDIVDDLLTGGAFWSFVPSEANAAYVATFGVPRMFVPRVPPAALQIPGTLGALSYYDNTPLKETLADHVDLEHLNNGDVRISVGAVNVRTGNFAYFDSAKQKIGLEHIMASGGLPPGFPPVEIEGEYYWDGGVVSNTPLQYVMEQGGLNGDATVFQIDLFPAEGAMPRTLLDVAEREKDIRYSSRTRLNTDMARHERKLALALKRLLAKLPPELKNDADAKLLADVRECYGHVDLMHLIYRAKRDHSQWKDFVFSRPAINEHWQAGENDAQISLGHPAWEARRKGKDAITVFDLARPGGAQIKA